MSTATQTLLEWLPAFLGGGTIGAIVVAAIRSRPQTLKIKADSEALLRTDLIARITALETARESDRAACDERVDRMEKRHDTAFRELRQSGEVAIRELKAEQTSLRHERNNMWQALNYIITEIKRTGDPLLASIAAAAEEMIERGERAIALEKGAMKARLP